MSIRNMPESSSPFSQCSYTINIYLTIAIANFHNYLMLGSYTYAEDKNFLCEVS